MHELGFDGLSEDGTQEYALLDRLRLLMQGNGRATLTQVFRYLEALNERRNPPVRDIKKIDARIALEVLPSHANISLNGEDFILRVKRPLSTQAPTLPDSLNEWVVDGWQNPSPTPVAKPEQGESDYDRVLFVDDPKRVLEFDSWLQVWQAWSTLRTTELAVERLYQLLYEQYSLLERDGERYELVLGDGFVRWKLPEGDVDHPILLLPVELSFDAPNAEFTISEGLRPVELYTAPLRSSEIYAPGLAKMRKQVEDQPEIHPLEEVMTTPFLKGVASSLDDKGVFAEAPGPATEDLQVFRSPTIFRRNRDSGISNAIRQVLDDLNEDGLPNPSSWLSAPPEGLMRFVGIETRPDTDSQGENFAPDQDEDIYFCKPANREQFRIVRKLNQSGCVLVQGPPGTGKTHTIANLIGHLLAEGKSVLVTSHTTKALSVVTEKVAESLQPLCVSVLESDVKNRDQLEASVRGIAERLSEGTEAYRRKGIELKELRSHTFKRIRRLQNDLRMARMSEYEEITYRGESFRPMEAAKVVAKMADEHGWIPGEVIRADFPPLTASEFETLYNSNRTVSIEDEENFPEVAPELGVLENPDAIDLLFIEVRRLREEYQEVRRDIVSRPLTSILQVVEHAIVLAEETIQFFAQEGLSWKKQLVDLAQRGESNTWDRLIQNAEDLNNRVKQVDELHLRVAPRWKEYSYTETISICVEIENHLTAGKKLKGILPWQNLGWKKTIQSLEVADGQPTTAEHFLAGRTLLEVAHAREGFVRVWNGRMAEVSGPTIDASQPRPERVALNYAEDIRSCLSWQSEFWPQLEAAIDATGLSFSSAVQAVPVQTGSVARTERLVLAFQTVLLPNLRILRSQILLANAESRLGQIKTSAQELAESSPTIPILQEVSSSIGQEDERRYRVAFGNLQRVYGRADAISERRALLKKLSDVAPSWARAIGAREKGFDGFLPIGDIQKAWMVKQLTQELNERSRISIQELVSRLAAAKKEAEALTIDLVEAKSWLNLIERTSMAMKLALSGYVQILKKIGKGTGKRVPRLILEAQKYMSQCQSAVPVWVMPLSRVVESFDLSKTKFDVVIIDEASQLDLNGLLAMYIAKQVIIVGDDKQVEPLAVGTNVTEIEGLIDEHLAGIPRAQLWDGKQSVYNLADGPFEPIRLREHFRCVPDIIRFSNQLCYGDILPLREDAGVETRPFVVPYYVSGCYLEGDRNIKEAQALVALLRACIEAPEYAGKTFGVIHLVGSEGSGQSKEIERLAREAIGDVELQARKFRCGSSAQFQGDERDVMFLAVVDVPKQGPLPMRSEDLFKKRFNVAASRARDQMWVIYSLNPDIDLQPGDLRRELITYANDPTARDRVLSEKSIYVESDFEKQVLTHLIAAGYTSVVPQYRVGAYRLDFAFRSGDLRVAIECDGDQFHGADKLDDDLARQETLERLGWKFIRIRGSEFYRNQMRTMSFVTSALTELGVHAAFIDLPTHDRSEGDLLTRLKAKAIEFLE